MSIVRFENVSKIFTTGDHELRALDQVSFTLDEGKFVVILGPSGTGKSTLLNLLGGLDSPTEGTITVKGADISMLTDNELADYRASTVGFVFQLYNLIPTLTVYENVKLVTEISKEALDAKEMIGKVGLLDHVNNFPSELSGGEQQRMLMFMFLMVITRVYAPFDQSLALIAEMFVSQVSASRLNEIYDTPMAEGLDVTLPAHGAALFTFNLE